MWIGAPPAQKLVEFALSPSYVALDRIFYVLLVCSFVAVSLFLAIQFAKHLTDTTWRHPSTHPPSPSVDPNAASIQAHHQHTNKSARQLHHPLEALSLQFDEGVQNVQLSDLFMRTPASPHLPCLDEQHDCLVDTPERKSLMELRNRADEGGLDSKNKIFSRKLKSMHTNALLKVQSLLQTVHVLESSMVAWRDAYKKATITFCHLREANINLQTTLDRAKDSAHSMIKKEAQLRREIESMTLKLAEGIKKNQKKQHEQDELKALYYHQNIDIAQLHRILKNGVVTNDENAYIAVDAIVDPCYESTHLLTTLKSQIGVNNTDSAEQTVLEENAQINIDELRDDCYYLFQGYMEWKKEKRQIILSNKNLTKTADHNNLITSNLRSQPSTENDELQNQLLDHLKEKSTADGEKKRYLRRHVQEMATPSGRRVCTSCSYHKTMALGLSATAPASSTHSRKTSNWNDMLRATDLNKKSMNAHPIIMLPPFKIVCSAACSDYNIHQDASNTPVECSQGPNSQPPKWVDLSASMSDAQRQHNSLSHEMHALIKASEEKELSPQRLKTQSFEQMYLEICQCESNTSISLQSQFSSRNAPHKRSYSTRSFFLPAPLVRRSRRERQSLTSPRVCIQIALPHIFTNST